MFQAHLLCETVPLVAGERLLSLNSAADPLISLAAQQIGTGAIILAEDTIATVQEQFPVLSSTIRHVPLHNYILQQPANTIDRAVMNLLYQPANVWMLYGLYAAVHALRTGGSLYVAGAKERGILTVGKRMQEFFGNVETITISKGHRVLCSRKSSEKTVTTRLASPPDLTVFAKSQLDEGTRQLLAALEVQATDVALDIGCGAGLIGLHLAHLACQGRVTMVDASLAAVAATQRAVAASGLTNIDVLPSNGAQAVLAQRFDLVVTNPPFHQGGIQTTKIAEQFMREAAQVLRPQGHFYLVANRFLKYEPILHACFKQVKEVGGDKRYKVLRASLEKG